jgi:hypothetical protein
MGSMMITHITGAVVFIHTLKSRLLAEPDSSAYHNQPRLVNTCIALGIRLWSRRLGWVHGAKEPGRVGQRLDPPVSTASCHRSGHEPELYSSVRLGLD